tara:strand:+ start:120 stop:2048 length:1929 start_codon:yes stop_codon:yes gene_type:complete
MITTAYGACVNTYATSLTISSDTEDKPYGSASAYYYCGALKHLTIGSAVRYLGKYSAYYSPYAETLTFEEGVEEIADKGLYLWGGYCTRCDASHELILPDSLTTLGTNWALYLKFDHIHVGSGLTYLPEYFLGYSETKNFTVPSTITEIHNLAFYYATLDCMNFEGEYLPKLGLSVFSNVNMDCGMFYMPDYPSSFSTLERTLNRQTFAVFHTTGDVRLPSNLYKIDREAFYDAEIGGNLIISPDLPSTAMNKEGFERLKILGSGNITFPDAWTVVQEQWGYSFEMGGMIHFNQITKIEYQAFYSAKFKGGYDMIIPDTVTEIQYSAFEYAELYGGSLSLTSPTLTIENKAFKDAKLSGGSLTLTSPTLTLGNEAFKNFEVTGDLHVLDSWVLGDDVFSGATFDNIYYCGKSQPKVSTYSYPSGTTLISQCVCPESVAGKYSVIDGVVTIDASVTVINFDDLAGCMFTDYGLHIPEGVTEIGAGAFAGATFLGDYDLHIPEGVTEIGNSAFDGASFSGDILIPKSVTTIGSSAFKNSINGGIHIPWAPEFDPTKSQYHEGGSTWTTTGGYNRISLNGNAGSQSFLNQEVYACEWFFHRRGTYYTYGTTRIFNTYCPGGISDFTCGELKEEYNQESKNCGCEE